MCVCVCSSCDHMDYVSGFDHREDDKCRRFSKSLVISPSLSLSLYIYVDLMLSVDVCVCVCVCVCVHGCLRSICESLQSSQRR